MPDDNEKIEEAEQTLLGDLNKFEEGEYTAQEDDTIWIRWGLFQEDDDEKRREKLFLVKTGTTIVGEILFLGVSKKYEGRYNMSLKVDYAKKKSDKEFTKLPEAITVSMAPIPSRLQTKLGLNKNMPQREVAEEGRRVAIQYIGLGKPGDKGGRPRLFAVGLGKKKEKPPEEEQDELPPGE